MLPVKLIAKSQSHEEHDEQKKLVLFITNYLMHDYPILQYLHANLNGISLRDVDKKTRAKINTQMTYEGRKAGVPDLFLPVNNGCYSGLYIEMKSKTGSLSPKQKEFITFVEQQGYKVVVPRSADEALSEIVEYCGLPKGIRLRDEMLMSA
jgi:VRR-NUC domain.